MADFPPIETVIIITYSSMELLYKLQYLQQLKTLATKFDFVTPQRM